MSHVDEGTLHAYLDGELPAGAERRALEVHLVSCMTCRSALEAARAVRERSGEILERSVPDQPATTPSFDEIVARAEARSSGRATRRLSRMRILAWAATIVVAAGVGSVVTLQLRSPTDTAEGLGTVAERTAAPQAAETAPRAQALRAQSQDPASSNTARGREAQRPAAEVTVVQQEAGEPKDSLTGNLGAAAPTSLASRDTPGVTADSPAVIAEHRVIAADSLVGGRANNQRRAEQLRVAEAEDVDSLTPPERIAQADEVPSAPAPVPTSDTTAADRRDIRGARDSAAPGLALDAAAVAGAGEEAEAAILPPWRDVSADEAARETGYLIATIAGLPILDHAVGEAGGHTAVRVLQRTEAGVVVELVQWRSAEADSVFPRPAYAIEEDARDSLTTIFVRSDGYIIRVRADLPEGEVQRLGERIR